MVTTDGFCHSHQPVYREIVSSKMARPPSPYHSNPQQRNVNKRTHTHTHTNKKINVPLSFLPGAKQGSDWKEQGEVGRLSDP
jgi:hypothetical protein